MDWNTIVDPCQLQNCSSSLNKITVLNFFQHQAAATCLGEGETLWRLSWSSAMRNCNVKWDIALFLSMIFGTMDPSFRNTFWHWSVLHFNEYKDNSNQLIVQLGHSPIIGQKHKTLHITCAPQPTVWVHVYRLSTCRPRCATSQVEIWIVSGRARALYSGWTRVSSRDISIIIRKWEKCQRWTRELGTNCSLALFFLTDFKSFIPIVLFARFNLIGAYYIFHQRER